MTGENPWGHKSFSNLRKQAGTCGGQTWHGRRETDTNRIFGLRMNYVHLKRWLDCEKEQAFGSVLEQKIQEKVLYVDAAAGTCLPTC